MPTRDYKSGCLRVRELKALSLLSLLVFWQPALAGTGTAKKAAPHSKPGDPPPPSPAPAGPPVAPPILRRGGTALPPDISGGAAAVPVSGSISSAGRSNRPTASLSPSRSTAAPVPTRIQRPGEAVSHPVPVKPTALPASDTRISRPGELKPLVPVPDTVPAATAPTGHHPAGTAVPASPRPATGAASQPSEQPALKNGQDAYPAIGKLEEVTLGRPRIGEPIQERLSVLETAVFKKTFNNDSLFDRTERLKRTLLGTDIDPGSAAAREQNPVSSSGWINSPHPALESASAVSYLDDLASRPENQAKMPAAQVAQFAVELINTERRNYGLSPLIPDNLAENLADTLVKDLGNRSCISHFSSEGLGPDRRYTVAEGTDALTECVASTKTSEPGSHGVCRAAAVNLVKVLLSRQDDRDALLSPDATHVGAGIARTADGTKMLAVFEVVSRHAVIGPLPFEASCGDKLEVKGVMQAPYQFDRITVAWEANNPDSGAALADESEEALPYFPPLDYVAYANHSEQNYDKAVTALKAVGMVAAIAGGLFIPPVALVAPLIAVSGSTAEPKPVSDIPIKGGVKLDGSAFSGKIPLSNNNKEGLYYVTVWANLGRGQKSIPVSRRVILARIAEERVKAVARSEDAAKGNDREKDTDKVKAKAAEIEREKARDLEKEKEKALKILAKAEARARKHAKKAAEKNEQDADKDRKIKDDPVVPALRQPAQSTAGDTNGGKAVAN